MTNPTKNLIIKKDVINYAFNLNATYSGKRLPLYNNVIKYSFSNSTFLQVDKGKRKVDDMDSLLEEKEAKSKKLTDDLPLDDQVMFDHTEASESEEKKTQEVFDREYAEWLQQEQYSENNFNNCSFEARNSADYNQESEYSWADDLPNSIWEALNFPEYKDNKANSDSKDKKLTADTSEMGNVSTQQVNKPSELSGNLKPISEIQKDSKLSNIDFVLEKQQEDPMDISDCGE